MASFFDLSWLKNSNAQIFKKSVTALAWCLVLKDIPVDSIHLLCLKNVEFKIECNKQKTSRKTVMGQEKLKPTYDMWRMPYAWICMMSFVVYFMGLLFYCMPVWTNHETVIAAMPHSVEMSISRKHVFCLSNISWQWSHILWLILCSKGWLLQKGSKQICIAHRWALFRQQFEVAFRLSDDTASVP